MGYSRARKVQISCKRIYKRGKCVCVCLRLHKYILFYLGINSYVNLPEWLELFDSAAGADAYKVIVGNKCDA